MLQTLKKLIHDCLTENDGKSFDPFRVAGFAITGSGLPTFLGCTIYAVYRSGTFDMLAFGTAFAAMLTGCAALAGGVAMKAKTDITTQDSNEKPN